MNNTLQHWIWLETLRTNWRAIQVRLMPASPALSRELAAIADRLKDGAPEQFADILDDLLELISGTEAADYVRALIAGNTLPQSLLISATREETLLFRHDEPRSRESTAEVIVEPRVPQAVMTQTSRALGKNMATPDRVKSVRVFFATNREPSGSQNPGERFGYGRSPDAVVGQVSVSIPVTHKKGNVEKPGYFQNQNVEDHFVIGSDLDILEMDAFREKLAQQFGADSNRELLVFIHGFNVSFEDALLRAAQLKEDLNFPGEIVLFTWPSRGSMLSYAADLSSAEFSFNPLAKFLAGISEGPWRRVNLLAHSMGGRVSVGGLVDSDAPKAGLGQLALVAADVSTDFFEQQFPKFSAKVESKTSYVASKDRALWFSGKFVNLTGRVGYLEKEPFVIDGMETVDASAVDRGLLAHSYFSDIRAVIDDLGNLLGNRLLAAQRRNLREQRVTSGKSYWQFPP